MSKDLIGYMQTNSKELEAIFREKILQINQRIFYYSTVRWLKHLFSAYIIHMKFHEDKLERPVIIVANHTSRWDPFFILSCIPKKFFSRNMVWRFPTLHLFFEQLRCIHLKYFLLWIGAYPIKGKGDLKKSLEKTTRVLDNGQNIIFFPEGKKVRNKEKIRPKKGIGYLIENSKFYILPAYISYSKRRRDDRGVKIGRACIVFGDKIKSEYFREKYKEDERHEEVMKRVYALSEMKKKYYPEEPMLTNKAGAKLIFSK